MQIAFKKESKYWSAFQLNDQISTKLSVINSSKGNFSTNIQDYLKSITDDEMVISIGIIYSYAIAEAAAEDILGTVDGGIESWGEKLLAKNQKNWSAVMGGKAGLVEVSVIRNILAHGSLEFDQRSINRLKSVNYQGPYKLGDKLALKFLDLEEYRSRIRSLFRFAGHRHPSRK